jgi:IclR family pca regulon transcriptional regulator
MAKKTEDYVVNTSEPINESYIVSTLVRGMKILSTFTEERPALKVSEIAEITHFDNATVFRFVYTLTQLGYLTLDGDSKRYRQAVRMLNLVLPARAGIPVRQVGVPLILELSRIVNETINLAILDGVEIVIIADAEVSYKLVYPQSIGARSPSYCTALGKVLLAYQPVENWDKLISKIEFIRRTENTIVDPDKFRLELEKVRKQSYATEESELIAGLNSIAVPIFARAARVVGAINISSLSKDTLLKEEKDYFLEELNKTSRSITTQLDIIS